MNNIKYIETNAALLHNMRNKHGMIYKKVYSLGAPSTRVSRYCNTNYIQGGLETTRVNTSRH